MTPSSFRHDRMKILALTLVVLPSRGPSPISKHSKRPCSPCTLKRLQSPPAVVKHPFEQGDKYTGSVTEAESSQVSVGELSSEAMHVELKSSIHGVVGTNSVGAISRLAPVTVALAVHRVQSWGHWGREPAPHWDSGNGEPVVTSNLSTPRRRRKWHRYLCWFHSLTSQHSTWCWHSAQSSESQWSCSPAGRGSSSLRTPTSRSVVTSWNVKSKSVMLKSTLPTFSTKRS
jgi:hypothetical protein